MSKHFPSICMYRVDYINMISRDSLLECGHVKSYDNPSTGYTQ